MRTRSGYRTLLLDYLGPQRVRVGVLTVLLGSGIVLPLVNPQIVRAFIDRAVGGTPTRTLAYLAALYIATALAIQAANLGTAYVSELVGWTATNELRADLADHALRLDMPYHNARTPGEMIERIDGDITALSTFFSEFVMSVLWGLLTTVGVILFVAREDWRFGAALAAYAAVSLFLYGRLRNIAVPHATAQREQSANLFGYLEERLQGLEDIRSSGAGDHVVRGFHLAGRALYRSAIRSEKAWAGTLWTSTNVIFIFGKLMALAGGAWLYRRGSITIGTVYLLYQYVQTLHHPLESIGDQLKEFQKAGAGAGRIGQLLACSPTVTDRAENALPAGALSVSFEDVTFAYRDEPVLDRIRLHVEAGRVLGVLGRTGSGKTTLARLVLRLWEPQSGRIELAGVDVTTAGLDDLRSRVGYVTQDVQLFGATVRDNVTMFGTARADDERIVSVVRTLGLGAWFDRLTDGLDTVLASGGAGLSAGEAQLLAFARVFLRDPGLVVLDEASSRLDPATEARIELAVAAMLQGRTGILIAHRLSTVQRADDIAVISDGRVVEHGPREVLAADPESAYSQLLRTGLEGVRV